MILEYVIKHHLHDCLNILSEQDILGYYCIKIEFVKLFETYPDVADQVLCSPVKTLQSCNKDIIKAQQNILEKEEYTPLLNKLKSTYLKRNVHARFFGLPLCRELHRTVFPKNVDLGCFLEVKGTVVRATQAKMLEYQRKYICTKCQYENSVEAEFEDRYILKAPKRCSNSSIRCKCSTFTQVNLVSREHCKDYQEIKIQEQVNNLSIRTIPGSMWVVLEDDLVDSCKPGDDIIICGTVRRRWRPLVQTKKSEVELVLQANYIEVSNTQRSEVIATAPDIKDCFDDYWAKYEQCPLKGRDQIIASVCPQVYGLYLVKLAVLLTVITGSNHIAEKESQSDDKHAAHVRGQCHLLLVGDPGTGKSQLLKAGAELTPRSVFTSGAGSTRAGLTCAALREDGEWQLEAGALVLSDGGVCCIDELSHLRDHDRTAIHEAMEQQTISVAKAGIVCKLVTRCAVIAACNPKGHYQTDQPLSVNVSLGTPLLSRFDLIFILLDSKNKSWDKLVSSYILFGDGNQVESKKKWTLEKLQMYIGLVGPRCTQMTKKANTILQCYYMMQRKSEYRDPCRTTVRMLDSLIRLSQAHCRLMYRTTILPIDAIFAISLVDLSMQDCTLEDTVDALHSTFVKYPDFQYLCTAKKLLTKLNLSDIWKEELLYYGKLLQIDHKTLECDIENGNHKLFARYDDVSDENVQLSASLVTSSYFNNKKNKEKDMNISVDIENLNEKLAATLKKHATLNKIEKYPSAVQKKTVKRKRKEVSIDTKPFVNKTIKKQTVKKVKKTAEPVNTSDSDECDINEMLNGVPSVNDVFIELGVDFKACQNIDTASKSDRNHGSNIKQHTDNPKCIDKENEIKSTKNNLIEQKLNKEKNLNTSLSKLKQFEFIGKRDMSKFYDKNNKDANVNNKDENVENNKTVVILENLKDRSPVVSFENPKKSVSSSQLSMFESSDCDIDLDL